MSVAFALDSSAFEPERTQVAALRAGDPAAFETLVRENGGRMLATARRLLRSEEDARDAVQDALLAAYRALPGFVGQARLSTWLHRITVNAALMKLRTRRRRPETLIADLLPRFDANGARLLETEVAPVFPEDPVERQQMRDAMKRGLDGLPDAYRSVLILRDVEDLDTEETARLLGTTVGAVKTRLHRARQALRTLVERELCG
jgi:RNA polymerase sigma-70 factor (ECF subfamily)